MIIVVFIVLIFFLIIISDINISIFWSLALLVLLLVY